RIERRSRGRLDRGELGSLERRRRGAELGSGGHRGGEQLNGGSGTTDGKAQGRDAFGELQQSGGIFALTVQTRAFERQRCRFGGISRIDGYGRHHRQRQRLLRAKTVLASDRGGLVKIRAAGGMITPN